MENAGNISFFTITQKCSLDRSASNDKNILAVILL